MELLQIVLLSLAMLCGLILIPFGLPGTFVIVGAAYLYALATGFAEITWTMLAVLLGAALAAEGIEALTGVLGARRYGSGTWGVAASIGGGIIGALLGAPLFFGLGSLPGALAGAFAAAVLAEIIGGRTTGEAVRAGWGTFLGRIAGTAVKVAVAVAMAVFCLQRALS